MPKKQPTPKKPSPTQKPSKKVLLLSIAAASIILVASVCILRGYMEQQRTLDELSAASKDLRVVYDKLLATYGNSVTESYFRNECTESSVEIGRGVVTCGPSGLMSIRTTAGVNEERNVIETALRAESSFMSIGVGDVRKLPSGGGEEVGLAFRHSDISCYASGVNDKHSGITQISLYCIKTVPDFLPGYTVVR